MDSMDSVLHLGQYCYNNVATRCNQNACGKKKPTNILCVKLSSIATTTY